MFATLTIYQKAFFVPYRLYRPQKVSVQIYGLERRMGGSAVTEI